MKFAPTHIPVLKKFGVKPKKAKLKMSQPMFPKSLKLKVKQKLPLKSGKQIRLMEMIAHGGGNRIGGPSPAVAEKLIHETPHSSLSQAMKKKRKFGNAK